MFINEDPRPYVAIKVRSRNLTALLDTGASISVIGQKGMIILKDLGFKVCDSTVKNIATATEKTIKFTELSDYP